MLKKIKQFLKDEQELIVAVSLAVFVVTLMLISFHEAYLDKKEAPTVTGQQLGMVTTNTPVIVPVAPGVWMSETKPVKLVEDWEWVRAPGFEGVGGREV